MEYRSNAGADTKGYQRKRFVLAELPLFELAIYYAVWIIHSVSAFFVAWTVSDKMHMWVHHWTTRSEYAQGYFIDVSDPEWSLYRKSIKQVIVASFVHLGAFIVIPKLFDGKVSRCILICLWLISAIYLTSSACVLIIALFSILVSSLAYYSRSQLIAWILCILFVLKANCYAYFSSSGQVYYREFNFYLYSAVKVLNFCAYLAHNPNIKCSEALLLRFAEYLLYPPYTSLLIVLFEDFDSQMNNVEKLRSTQSDQFCNLKAFGMRLILLTLWFFTYEFILHFIYANSLFNSPPTLISGLNNYELASVAYVNGQLFYIKYVIMFGIPSWFASVDGMNPPGPPICISRVSRYSRMWRCFDRGLYQFLKHQVYIPLMGDPLSPYFQIRRFAAMVSAFLFVLAWHGTNSNYVHWVVLSGIELSIERLASVFANMKIWNRFSDAVGPRHQRRTIAAGMLMTVIPGIFGVFFFLGREGIGKTIFKKILIDGAKDLLRLRLYVRNGIPTAGFVFIHLLLLGYCFNHVCLQLDESVCKAKVFDETELKKTE